MHDTENTFSDKCTERKLFKKSEMTEKKTDLNVLQKTVSFELLKKPTSWYKKYIKKKLIFTQKAQSVTFSNDLGGKS